MTAVVVDVDSSVCSWVEEAVLVGPVSLKKTEEVSDEEGTLVEIGEPVQVPRVKTPPGRPTRVSVASSDIKRLGANRSWRTERTCDPKKPFKMCQLICELHIRRLRRSSNTTPYANSRGRIMIRSSFHLLKDLPVLGSVTSSELSLVAVHKNAENFLSKASVTDSQL